MRSFYIYNQFTEFYREGEDYSFYLLKNQFLYFIEDCSTHAFFVSLCDADDIMEFKTVLNRFGYKILINGQEA